MVTQASEWKKNSGAQKHHELPLPSGNVCLVRRPGLQAFVTSGMIPNGLMALVMPTLQKSQDQGRQGNALEIQDDLETLGLEVTKDPARLADMVTLVDRVTLHCVVEPPVAPVPVWTAENAPDPEFIGKEAASLRSDNVLYVDEVDFEDKLAIFNFAVGGPKELEPFRSAADSALAD